MRKRQMVKRLLGKMADANGYDLQEVHLSSKYRQFEFVTNGVTVKRFFIGKSGALRTGKAVKSSISLTHMIPQLMQKYC